MAGKFSVVFDEEGNPTATVSGALPVESQKHLQGLLQWVGVNEVHTEGEPYADPGPEIEETSTFSPTIGQGQETRYPPGTTANDAHFTQSQDPGSMGGVNIQDAGMVPPMQQPEPQPSLNIAEEKMPGVVPKGWVPPGGMNEPPSPHQDSFSPAAQLSPHMLPVAPEGTATPIMDVLVAEEQGLPDVQVIQPPQGFTREQWSMLDPHEQVRYWELQPLMNDAINRSDHVQLRKVSSEITSLQRKMRDLTPFYDTTAPVPTSLQSAQLQQNQQTQPTYKGLVIEASPSLYRSDIRLEKALFGWLDLGNPLHKSASAKHKTAEGHEKQPSSSHRYLWKEWKGNYWRYYYSDSPHPKNHGLGETAVHAASHYEPHSIEVHNEVDLGRYPDAASAYRATVRLTARNNPEQLTWVKQHRDGTYGVYQQNAVKQSEVSYSSHAEKPEKPHEVDMGPEHRISLSGYQKKHVSLKHQNAGEDEKVVEEWKTPQGKLQAVLVHQEGAAYPWQIHEFGPKKIVPEGKSYGEYATEQSARRALRFHQAFDHAYSSDSRKGKVFEGKGTSKLDPKKYPISHRLESGEMEYAADKVQDPLTGHYYYTLIPQMSREEHRAFITEEVGGIIEKSVRDLTKDYGLSPEQTKSLVRTCALEAWQVVQVRQGGKKTGGFEPGESTNLFGLLKTSLRSQSGPIQKWLASNSEAPEEGEKEGSSSSGRLRGKAYITGEEWKTNFRESWVDAQKQNWMDTVGLSLKGEAKQKAFAVMSEELSNIKNRSQAQRWSSERAWASRPLTNQLVEGEMERSEVVTPEQSVLGEVVDQWEGFSPEAAMEQAVKDISGTDPKKKELLSLMSNNLMSNMDGEEQMRSASEKMEKLFPDKSLKERQKQLRSWIREFASHSKVEDTREFLARSLIQPLNPEDALPRKHPLYGYATGILLRSKCGSILKSISDELSGDNLLKRWVLNKSVLALLDGTFETVEGARNWITSTSYEVCNRLVEAGQVHRTEEKASLHRKSVDSVKAWLGELCGNEMFKGLQWMVIAHDHSIRSEQAYQMGKLWVLGGFEKDIADIA